MINENSDLYAKGKKIQKLFEDLSDNEDMKSRRGYLLQLCEDFVNEALDTPSDLVEIDGKKFDEAKDLLKEIEQKTEDLVNMKSDLDDMANRVLDLLGD